MIVMKKFKNSKVFRKKGSHHKNFRTSKAGFKDAGQCVVSDVLVFLEKTLDSLLSLPKNLWVEVLQFIKYSVQALQNILMAKNESNVLALSGIAKKLADFVPEFLRKLGNLLSASQDMISAIGQDENNSFKKLLNNSAKCLELL
ncbi:hypothetical protein GCK72_011501 [Caenorhabditis remanei]|uniref:Uncharacterized protein n=1 Tax=Caenorhabditis remanei TaxID=31234 RepID=A0A6A5H7Z1_CAERE|nr:hypothetical protein GCK72_011501 [Caenorhabditis remanei]KAF1763235.1 hypothetical protein GCK72_011501 [Caenorhabditis remanei]